MSKSKALNGSRSRSLSLSCRHSRHRAGKTGGRRREDGRPVAAVDDRPQTSLRSFPPAPVPSTSRRPPLHVLVSLLLVVYQQRGLLWPRHATPPAHTSQRRLPAQHKRLFANLLSSRVPSIPSFKVAAKVHHPCPFPAPDLTTNEPSGHLQTIFTRAPHLSKRNQVEYER